MLVSEPSSSSSTSTCSFPAEARIACATASPFGTSRAVRITWAPRVASTRAVSCPSPLDPPVTNATLPRRSMPSATSLAVVSAPNFVASRIGDDRPEAHLAFGDPVQWSVHFRQRVLLCDDLHLALSDIVEGFIQVLSPVLLRADDLDAARRIRRACRPAGTMP